MNIETIREFLAWCTLINLGLMIFTAIMLLALQGPISRLHARMLDLDETFVRQSYFRYLANYKIAFLIFNLVPYLALRIMA